VFFECADKQFFHNLGFSIEDFHAITWLTSWALSGTEEHGLTEPGALMEASDLPVDHAHAVAHVSSKPRLSEAMNAIDATARAVLGRKCKRLIDTGRLQWLTERGMQAKLVEYIAASVSPENRLLLARWANVMQ
jgi:tRNA:m4X modification enzyme